MPVPIKKNANISEMSGGRQKFHVDFQLRRPNEVSSLKKFLKSILWARLTEFHPYQIFWLFLSKNT